MLFVLSRLSLQLYYSHFFFLFLANTHVVQYNDTLWPYFLDVDGQKGCAGGASAASGFATNEKSRRRILRISPYGGINKGGGGGSERGDSTREEEKGGKDRGRRQSGDKRKRERR